MLEEDEEDPILYAQFEERLPEELLLYRLARPVDNPLFVAIVTI